MQPQNSLEQTVRVALRRCGKAANKAPLCTTPCARAAEVISTRAAPIKIDSCLFTNCRQTLAGLMVGLALRAWWRYSIDACRSKHCMNGLPVHALKN
jgi:hypothetical protein